MAEIHHLVCRNWQKEKSWLMIYCYILCVQK